MQGKAGILALGCFCAGVWTVDAAAAEPAGATLEAKGWIAKLPEAQKKAIGHQVLAYAKAARPEARGQIWLLPAADGSSLHNSALHDLRIGLPALGWDVYMPGGAAKDEAELTGLLSAAPAEAATVVWICQAEACALALKAALARESMPALVMLSTTLAGDDEALKNWVQKTREPSARRKPNSPGDSFTLDVFAEADNSLARARFRQRQAQGFPASQVRFLELPGTGHDYLHQRDWLLKQVHGFALRAKAAATPQPGKS